MYEMIKLSIYKEGGEGLWVSVVVLDGYLAGTDLAAASIKGKSKRLLVSVTGVIGICRTGKDRSLIRTKL